MKLWDFREGSLVVVKRGALRCGWSPPLPEVVLSVLVDRALETPVGLRRYKPVLDGVSPCTR